MQCARKRRSALPVGDALNRQFAGDTGEAGYLLIAVVFFVALVTLSLAVAAPRIAASIQRDRELEAVQRGLQYKRAIRLYYKKYNAYPTSVDQLVKSNDIRFLRRRYLDPMTGKDDWKVLHQGETHVCPLGFFGQPLSVGSSSSIAGATPVGASTSSGSGLGAGMSSGFGGSSTGFGGSSSGFGSSGGSSGFGSSNTSGTGGTGSSGSSTATCGTTSVAGSTGAGAGTGAGMGSGTGSGMGLAGAGTSAGADSGTGGSGFGGSRFQQLRLWRRFRNGNKHRHGAHRPEWGRQQQRNDGAGLYRRQRRANCGRHASVGQGFNGRLSAPGPLQPLGICV